MAGLTCPLELPKECGLQLTISVIICLGRLEDLVESLEQKRPEVIAGPIVTHAVGSMYCIMMIRLYDA
jgi:hypothetical protein